MFFEVALLFLGNKIRILCNEKSNKFEKSSDKQPGKDIEAQCTYRFLKGIAKKLT
jgi:hypothetical protein